MVKGKTVKRIRGCVSTCQIDLWSSMPCQSNEHKSRCKPTKYAPFKLGVRASLVPFEKTGSLSKDYWWRIAPMWRAPSLLLNFWRYQQPSQHVDTLEVHARDLRGTFE